MSDLDGLDAFNNITDRLMDTVDRLTIKQRELFEVNSERDITRRELRDAQREATGLRLQLISTKASLARAHAILHSNGIEPPPEPPAPSLPITAAAPVGDDIPF